MTDSIAWGNKVSPEFRQKLIRICNSFCWSKLHASWLMSCIAFESAETFSADVKNAAGSGAVGLIQFMPFTAKGLGTTTEALSKLTPEEQLDYVAQYFQPYAKKIFSLSDMYMAILLPKYVGKAEGSVLFSGGVAYRQNSGLDKNKDGRITKAEASEKIQAKLLKGMTEKYRSEWSE